MFLSYINVYISSEVIGFLAIISLAYPYILLVNLLFSIFWIIRKKRYFLYSLIAIAIGWQHLNNFIRICPQEKESKEESQNVKILSYNVRLFDLYNWTKDKYTKNKIFDFILYENPDIICFQEFYSKKTDSLPLVNRLVRMQRAKNVHFEYYHKNKVKYNYGIATFSIYPIVNKGIIRYPNSNNFSIFTDLKIKKDTIRVFNNHLESIHFGYQTYNFIDSIDYKNRDQKLKGIKDIAKKLNSAFEKRAIQAEILAKHIKKSPYPVVVCGDFNDTPLSYSYRLIRENLEDAFVNSGFGIGNTYVHSLSTFRIDYILHSPQIKSYQFETPQVKLSDHYPIKCLLEIGK